jgi:hypothetical protein
VVISFKFLQDHLFTPPLGALNLVPRLKVLGQVMEKETRHIFISLFLVQGRGGLGLIPLLQQLCTFYNLYKAKKSGKFLSKKA